MSKRSAVLYDADCQFCMVIASAIEDADRHGRLRPVAIQDPEGQALLARLTPEEQLASFHLVGPDGVVRSGGEVLPALARLLPLGDPVARALALRPALTGRGYRLIADHRVGISRFVPSALKRRARRRLRR